MNKTILVAIDLSHKERIEPMLETARLLAQDDTKIVLANVVEDIPSYVAAQIPSDALGNVQAESLESLNEIAEQTGPNAVAEIRRGHAGNTLLEIADDMEVDVIIIASHKPGWEDYLIGSTAARVVRHAKCAVYILR